MGFAVSLIITVVGFILALAVHPNNPGSVDVNTVGWILVVFGLIAFFADLLLWSSWGPGYLRRTYVEHRPGYGAYPPGPGYDSGYGSYPPRRGFFRRRVVEEDDAGPPPGPGY